MTAKRTIPRSQAIYPYGVGAILDWGQECFVVLDTRGYGWRRAPKIDLPRLQNRLGAPDGFRLPPVMRDDGPMTKLRAQRFPSWLFCPRCRRMWRWGREEEVRAREGMPKCLGRGCGSVLVPMRYVAVCEGGHMTDVNWHRWAHAAVRATAPCGPQSPELYFDARGDKGATLDALAIRCGRCGSRQTLKELLNRNSLKRIGQKCWGRQPWQNRSQETSCDQTLRVLQRSQTAVHYADIVSALDLTVEPEESSEFDDIMQAQISALGVSSPGEAAPFVSPFARSASRKLGRPVGEAEVQSWLERHFVPRSEDPGQTDPFNQQQVLFEEWPALTTPTGRSTFRAPLIVRQDEDSESSLADLESMISSVYLVERLREVRAFRGFRRVRPDAMQVPPDLGIEPRQTWCMAFAQLTYRESLRDIEVCLRAQRQKLYFLSFRSPVSRNTLANANKQA